MTDPYRALPSGYIDPEHKGEDLALLETFYRGACIAEGGTVDEIQLRGIRAVLATHSTPQPPADGELTVNLRMDLSSECLKRLCDGLAAAVIPNGGYRELTTDDDISGEFIGEQQVSVTWWLPEHGCDSLENTLDAIKGRLCAAVRDWLPTAVTATPQPVPQPVPVSERLPGPEDVNEDGEVWIIEEGYSYALGNDTGDYGWAEHMIVLRSIGEFDAKNGRTWLPANALPTPEALDD
jgi:hypothetical protein